MGAIITSISQILKKWGTVRLDKMPKFTQLISGQDEIQTYYSRKENKMRGKREHHNSVNNKKNKTRK